MLFIPIAKRSRPCPEIIAIDDDSDSEGSGPIAKRMKVESDQCVICLEEDPGEKIRTQCCMQKAHVSCVRTHYCLPATQRTQRGRDVIARKLGIPNCFVCRGNPDQIVPLTRDVIDAILPKIDLNSWCRQEANKAICTWQDMLHDTVVEWCKNWKFLMSLDSGYASITYKDGNRKTNRLVGFDDCSPRETAQRISQQLMVMVPEWAGLAKPYRSFDDMTSKNCCLDQICELTLTFSISNSVRQVIRSTLPGARPFDVEPITNRLSSSISKGYFFDFDDIDYEGRKGRFRTFHWCYKNLGRYQLK